MGSFSFLPHLFYRPYTLVPACLSDCGIDVILSFLFELLGQFFLLFPGALLSRLQLLHSRLQVRGARHRPSDIVFCDGGVDGHDNVAARSCGLT